MATYLRPQLQTRIAAPKRQPYLHDVLNQDLLTTTLAAAAPAGVPFLPTVWPNPSSKRGAEQTWIRSLDLGALAIVPVRPPQFDNPRGRSKPYDLLTWLNPGLQAVVVVQAPFSAGDWANPVRRRGVAQQFDTSTALTLLFVDAPSVTVKQYPFISNVATLMNR